MVLEDEQPGLPPSVTSQETDAPEQVQQVPWTLPPPVYHSVTNAPRNDWAMYGSYDVPAAVADALKAQSMLLPPTLEPRAIPGLPPLDKLGVSVDIDEVDPTRGYIRFHKFPGYLSAGSPSPVSLLLGAIGGGVNDGNGDRTTDITAVCHMDRGRTARAGAKLLACTRRRGSTDVDECQCWPEHLTPHPVSTPRVSLPPPTRRTTSVTSNER